MKYSVRNLLEQTPYAVFELIDRITGDDSLREIRIERAWNLEQATHSDITFWNGPGMVPPTESLVTIVPSSAEFRPPESRLYIWTKHPRLILAYMLKPFCDDVWRRDRHITFNQFTSGPVILNDVTIGSGTMVGSCTVLSNCVIGVNCRIWHNVTIGGDGFAFETNPYNGEVLKIPHFGKVIIHDRVEIQSGTHIARGSFQNTIIENDVKVDQLVHIAHNCHIKRGTLIPAGAMLAGSVTVGEHSWIAPETAINNGITLGKCSMTGTGAVVIEDVGDNELVVGVPAKKKRDRFPGGYPLLEVE